MKTLLQINLCVNAYSTGKIVEQIGNEAQRRGWRSIVAYGYDVYHDNISSAASSNSETIFIGGKMNRSIHNLFLENNKYNNLWNY